MSNQASKATLNKQVLEFNVAQQLKQQGGAPRAFVIEDAVLPFMDADLVLLAPLSGLIKLIKTDTGILVTGTLSTVLELPCTRCLAPVSVAVSMEIEETFTPRVDIVTGGKLSQSPDVDATTLISEQHILDLTEVVRQSLYLAQPAQILCKEDCLGLCPQCGKNRNQVQCNCTEETIDSRWADLLALKNKMTD
ncbi:MAG TPA: DUF177 domain-containing protein [Chloroflexi bacterium]|nr:DUF177 domain-containing protein [Chloroflexota bacterium]